MRLFYASSIVAIAIKAVCGNTDPNNVIPQFECRNYYQKFSPEAEDSKQKRVCHGYGGQKRKRLYSYQSPGDTEPNQYRTVVFDVEQIYDASKDQTPVKYIDLPRQLEIVERDTIDHLFRVESSESPEYVLAGRGQSNMLYAIKDIPTSTTYSWSLNITEGFNPNTEAEYIQNPTDSQIKSIIQDIDSTTLLIGTQGSTIEVLSDLKVDTGDYDKRGQLYFDSLTHCYKEKTHYKIDEDGNYVMDEDGNRVRVVDGVRHRAVDTMAMSNDWIGAGSIVDGCGISIYPRTAIEDAVTQGPQAPAYVLFNDFLEGPVYSVVALEDGNMAVAASDTGYRNCIVTYYDMANITEPKLLGNITSLGSQCSVGPMIEDESTGELLKGVSTLTEIGSAGEIKFAFASFDLQNERVFSALDYDGSETNNLEALKDSSGKISRVAAANDNSAHIFKVDGTFCKLLYTNRHQAKSLQQLGDGSLAVGTVQGKVALYSRDVVFGSCDNHPVADVILSSHQVMDPVDSMMTMADGTVVQARSVLIKPDYPTVTKYYVEIFSGKDILSAVNEGRGEIPSSTVIEVPFNPNLFVFGSTILVTNKSDFGDPAKQVCILNTDQLRNTDFSSEEVVDSGSACEWVSLPLTPDERSRLGTPRFTSLSDSSFAVLSPGATWNETRIQIDVPYWPYFDYIYTYTEAPFKVQRYDQGEDLEWVLSSSIDGRKMGGSSTSIVTIQDDCVVFLLTPDDRSKPLPIELYFANVGINDDTTTLTFPSNVTKIDTIDGHLVVAMVDGHVYMLDKINMSSCGYDATQLDSAKGFSTNDGKFDVMEKLQDGSYAIVASYGGSRRILMYEKGPQFPFAAPDYSINTLLNEIVTSIDEFAAPGSDDLNLVVYGEKSAIGVFYPEAHSAHNGRYGSPPTPQSPSSPSPTKKVTPSPTMRSPSSPSPTKNPVTPSPITPSPSTPAICASIKDKRSCKKSRCKWKKSSRTCQKKSGGDSKSGKGGKRGKSPKNEKLFE